VDRVGLWIASGNRSDTNAVNGNANDYVTLTGAADAANIPASTLRRWIENGRLPATTGDRGRLVRLADVWRLVEAPDGAPEQASNGIPERALDQITSPAATAEDMAPPVLAVAPSPARRQRAGPAATAAYMSKLDELYRAQIDSKNGEIATKDELIVELRRRAELAEREAMALAQRLAEARESHDEHTTSMPAQPPATTPTSLTFLLRLLHWYRQR